MGGLSRRAYILNEIRHEETKPILVLDAGAMLFPLPVIADSQVQAKKIQASGIIEAMARMGYDAVGLSPLDLAAGIDFLLQQPAARQLPWLSANLLGPENDKPLFKPYVIVKAGDLSIGILGLTGQIGNTILQKNGKDYKIGPWEKALQNTLTELRGRTAMNILLSSMQQMTNREIANKYDEIQLIIQSGQSARTIPPQVFGNALLAQIGSKGKQIGRLDIHWNGSHQWKYENISQAADGKKRLDQINWQITRLKRRLSPGAVEQDIQYRRLVAEKERLTASLAQPESQTTLPTDQFSTYHSSVIDLPVALPEDPVIKEIVRKAKLAANKTNQSAASAAGKQQYREAPDAFSSLAGWKKCQPCHAAQTNFWLKTGHARAWQTLAEKNQQYIPDCLICHITLPTYTMKEVLGLNLLGGLKEEYRGVGCETCHGPAKNHAQQPYRFRPRHPDEKTCRTCHTPERDANFDYEIKLEKIRCPKSGH